MNADSFSRELKGFGQHVEEQWIQHLTKALTEIYKTLVESTPMATAKHKKSGRARSHWNISAEKPDFQKSRGWVGEAWKHRISEAPKIIEGLLKNPFNTKIYFTNGLGYIHTLNNRHGSFVELTLNQFDGKL